MSGTLYLVGTPVGDLQDITLRALETLKSVAVIACEDTRQTAKLLRHYGVTTPTLSLHEHNERARTPALVERLKAGESVAVVSDGGTPLISDPGWWLVHQAIEEGVPVSWVPGPAALIGALVLSGLPLERFAFEGFLPIKSGQRRKRLEALREEERTVVLYESPHRLLKTLQEIQGVVGEVQIACARELTKMFEEVYRGSISGAQEYFNQRAPRGEFVLVLQSPSHAITQSRSHRA